MGEGLGLSVVYALEESANHLNLYYERSFVADATPIITFPNTAIIRIL